MGGGNLSYVGPIAFALIANTFRYGTGVEATRLSNGRGSVVVLPYLGQIVWSAIFDGVELAMQSMFREPRPPKVIVETYGCFAYHAGLLRNGVPSPADAHILDGEMPCSEIDEAGIACGADDRGPWIAVIGLREYAIGFGAHYRATPRVTLRPGEAGCEIVMEVENLSAAPMDLMSICHVNFAFAAGTRIVQPAPFTPEHVITRTVVPGHVTPRRRNISPCSTISPQTPGACGTFQSPSATTPNKFSTSRA
jgi:hypothetical protein